MQCSWSVKRRVPSGRLQVIPQTLRKYGLGRPVKSLTRSVKILVVKIPSRNSPVMEKWRSKKKRLFGTRKKLIYSVVSKMPTRREILTKEDIILAILLPLTLISGLINRFLVAKMLDAFGGRFGLSAGD